MSLRGGRAFREFRSSVSFLSSTQISCSDSRGLGFYRWGFGGLTSCTSTFELVVLTTRVWRRNSGRRRDLIPGLAGMRLSRLVLSVVAGMCFSRLVLSVVVLVTEIVPADIRSFSPASPFTP